MRLPERVRRDAEPVREIWRVHEANFRVYCARKDWRQLGRECVVAPRCTREWLIKSSGLRGVVRGRRCRMTIADGSAERHLDRMNRQLKANRPNDLCFADLTDAPTWNELAYVPFIADVFAVGSSAGAWPVRCARIWSWMQITGENWRL